MEGQTRTVVADRRVGRIDPDNPRVEMHQGHRAYWWSRVYMAAAQHHGGQTPATLEHSHGWPPSTCRDAAREFGPGNPSVKRLARLGHREPRPPRYFLNIDQPAETNKGLKRKEAAYMTCKGPFRRPPQ